MTDYYNSVFFVFSFFRVFVLNLRLDSAQDDVRSPASSFSPFSSLVPTLPRGKARLPRYAWRYISTSRNAPASPSTSSFVL